MYYHPHVQNDTNMFSRTVCRSHCVGRTRALFHYKGKHAHSSSSLVKSSSEQVLPNRPLKKLLCMPWHQDLMGEVAAITCDSEKVLSLILPPSHFTDESHLNETSKSQTARAAGINPQLLRLNSLQVPFETAHTTELQICVDLCKFWELYNQYQQGMEWGDGVA